MSNSEFSCVRAGSITVLWVWERERERQTDREGGGGGGEKGVVVQFCIKVAME